MILTRVRELAQEAAALKLLVDSFNADHDTVRYFIEDRNNFPELHSLREKVTENDPEYLSEEDLVEQLIHLTSVNNFEELSCQLALESERVSSYLQESGQKDGEENT